MTAEEPTRFMESNALLAIQKGDHRAAEEILDRMYPHELRELGKAAFELGYLCRMYEREKRSRSK